MSYRTRVLLLGGLVALPLLLLAVIVAARDQLDRERALNQERVAVAHAIAAATDGFLSADIAAVRALAALGPVQHFPTTDLDELEQAMRPVFDAFPNLETFGLIGPDGWNVLSLTRHVPVAGRSVNVSDRSYFRQAQASGDVVVSPTVLSRVRPGVPVVAIAVPIAAPDGAADPSTRGVLVGTLSLGHLQERLRAVLPDPRLGVVLVDSDGQVLVGPGVDPAAIRELATLRGRPDVDAVLAGQTDSLHVQPSSGGEELLVSFAPVPKVGWGVLVQQPAAAALGPTRLEVVRSVSLLVVALALSFLLALFLSSRLAGSYRELDEARLAAEQALEVRDAFLATVSHDLKNPLAAITAQAQLLQRQLTRADAPESAASVVHGVSRIEATARRMDALINELVDVARLRMGQAPALERTPTDLVALARQAVADYQQVNTTHDLRLEASESKLVGGWDGGRLERVLDNLLGNAVKYSQGGEVTVRVAREGQWAVLGVGDRGVGIPADDLPRLFEPFYRGQNVERRVGAGLGLWGVRQIVEEHGGTIAVESKEGVGTVVTVRLPLDGAEQTLRATG